MKHLTPIFLLAMALTAFTVFPGPVQGQVPPSSLSYGTVMWEQTTTFPYRGGHLPLNRSFNIRLAASRVNGTIILPGQTFSFNDVVGPRTQRAGFRKAKMINAEGRLVDSFGGGVCQAATTTFAAALFAGLTIVETRPHSHYMSYIDPGLDTTVIFDKFDLKIRNDFSFPVMIQTQTEPNRGYITVRVLGARRVFTVRSHIQETSRRDAPREIRVSTQVAPGTRHRIEPGSDLLRGTQTVRYYDVLTNTEVRHTTRRLSYEASPEVWFVNPVPTSSSVATDHP